ncbi:ABC transporter permease [Maledivibacter halophilus]|uniref:ABC-2 family transporter protein n=1 Tax=Maledivibacter halophilus TaxID=36842 RepID=A0A1T5LAI9_9FIRM|nr:ABC transporter permease subunit [Maledivibacter halophilus]SKC72924.1 ABC-2 family transporter protein [Maledivibacter halophilus]
MIKINPVLKKELKVRTRSWKMPITISLYLFLLCAFLGLLASQMFFGYSNYRGIRIEELKFIYIAITIFQLMLIAFIIPATTASSICGEKERRTFDLLLCTRLSSFSIVSGKLSAALSLMIILLIVSIPIFSIFFLFGVITPANVLILFAYYLITALLFGSIGIFGSAFFRKTTTSTIFTYFLVLMLVFGTGFCLIVFRMFIDRAGINNTSSILKTIYNGIAYINPMIGIGAILEDQFSEGTMRHFLIGKKVNMNYLEPLYYNMAFSFISSCILLFITSLKINPMKKFGNRGEDKKNRKRRKKKDEKIDAR